MIGFVNDLRDKGFNNCINGNIIWEDRIFWERDKFGRKLGSVIFIFFCRCLFIYIAMLRSKLDI